MIEAKHAKLDAREAQETLEKTEALEKTAQEDVRKLREEKSTLERELGEARRAFELNLAKVAKLIEAAPTVGLADVAPAWQFVRIEHGFGEIGRSRHWVCSTARRADWTALRASRSGNSQPRAP